MSELHDALKEFKYRFLSAFIYALMFAIAAILIHYNPGNASKWTIGYVSLFAGLHLPAALDYIYKIIKGDS